MKYAEQTFLLKVERQASGVWFVTSPDLPGFLVAKRTRDEALDDVSRAITELEIVRSESGK